MENTIASILAFGISLCFAALILTGIYAHYERSGWRGWLKEFGVLLGITGVITVIGFMLTMISAYLAVHIVSLFF